MDEGADDLLEEQIAYYRARAGQYDNWWYRTRQYALTPERKAVWDAEVARLEAAVDELAPVGAVLELAAGTGLWTRRLVAHADHVTAVDAAPEVLALNAARLPGAPVTYVEADLFDWEPPARYDVVFFSFWISHVPPERIESFWSMVRRALVPGGRAIFIDNRWGDGTWREVDERPAHWVQERTDLDDGRRFRVVKVYYETSELEAQLDGLGWDATVTTTGPSFILGWATPR